MGRQVSFFTRQGAVSLGLVFSLTVAAGRAADTVTVDFEDLDCAAGAYWNGSDLAGGFTSASVFFRNDYEPSWGSWAGFAFSRVNLPATAGWNNQYAVYEPGVGAGGSGCYAVVYDSPVSESDVVRFQTACRVNGLFVNNTAYTALAMRDGDPFSKKFGGATGDDPDWLRLRITGKDSEGNFLGSVDVYLADYRFADNALDYIVSDWTWVDLGPIGERVKTLHFELSSSDSGPWGMNTPAYFAIDNLQLTPDLAVVESGFDDLPFQDGGYWNGADLAGGFDSGWAHFSNLHNPDWGSWSGFAGSEVNAPSTPGWGNQYAVYEPGTDVTGTGGYAVIYDSAWDDADIVTLRTEGEVQGFYINNTAYTALTMRDGDPFAKKFGGPTGGDPDWFKVTISGEDSAGNRTGDVDFYLADYRFEDPARDYIVNAWTWVDLAPLGPCVKRLRFTLSSSDSGAWGMNTPAYFAMDGLKVIPSRALYRVDFEDVSLAGADYWNGADLAGGFTSRDVYFGNRYDPAWQSWAGFACSRVEAPATPGWANQYAVYEPGTGRGGSGHYAVIYDDTWGAESDIVSLRGDHAVQGFFVNNTAYAALTMRDGGTFAKKFGGASGSDPDWFKLTVTGRDRDGTETGRVEFYLADYRFEDSARDYLVEDWTWVDLSPLGRTVRTLHFSLSSSDSGAWGMNTPGYVAMDDLYAIRTGPPNDFIGTIGNPLRDWAAALAAGVGQALSGLMPASLVGGKSAGDPSDPALPFAPESGMTLSKAVGLLQGQGSAAALFHWVRCGMPPASPGEAPAWLAHLPDGRYVGVDAATVVRRNPWPSRGYTRLGRNPAGHVPTFVAVSPDGQAAVGYTGGASNGVYTFDAAGETPLAPRRLTAVADPRHGAFRDGNRLLVGAVDGAAYSILQLRAVDGVAEGVVFSAAAAAVSTFDVGPDGCLYVANGTDGSVVRFSAASLDTAVSGATPLLPPDGVGVHAFGGGNRVESIAVDAFGRVWASGPGTDGLAMFCPVLNEEILVAPGGATARYRVAAFTRAGRAYVAFSSVDDAGSAYGYDLAAFFNLYPQARPFSVPVGGSNVHDRGIPGFVGPHGEGAARLDNGDGTFQNPDNRVNPLFVAWASGYRDYEPADDTWNGGTWDQPETALGPVSGLYYDIVSLGELEAGEIAAGDPPGTLTLTFDIPIADAEGPDFAVFENAFGSGETDAFAEFGYVEVSSDGTHFARFPSVCLIEEAVGWYAPVDARAVYNLCGKHVNANGDSWGTPFDLGDLLGHPLVDLGLVDLTDIRYVRIVDVPGDGSFKDASVPARSVYDSWPTSGSGGLDLAAVGVINFRLECEFVQTKGGQTISWRAVTNRMYQAQWTDDLPSGLWHPIGSPVVGDNQLHQAVDPDGATAPRFYRVVQWP